MKTMPKEHLDLLDNILAEVRKILCAACASKPKNAPVFSYVKSKTEIEMALRTIKFTSQTEHFARWVMNLEDEPKKGE
jgi:hypothetical protein